jgi:hypothetical protein
LDFLEEKCVATNFTEMEQVLSHLIISMSFSVDPNGSLEGRKKVCGAIIQSLSEMREGLSKQDTIELVKHINLEIENLYISWRDTF